MVGLGIAIAWLLVPRQLIAKPQESICCGTISGGSLPFMLVWNTSNSNEATWTAFVTVNVYDSNGNEVSGYPVDDPTGYTSTTVGSCPGMVTGPNSESIQDPPTGGSVVLNCSGQWNGSYCSTSFASSCNVAFTGDKRTCAGEPNKYDVWLNVTNSGTAPADLRFVYSLVRKTDPDNGVIIPLTETDSLGARHNFRRMRHTEPGPNAGKTAFVIPANTTQEIHDLRIDLSKGINPGDYVYLDVFVIDATDHGHVKGLMALPRLQVYP